MRYATNKEVILGCWDYINCIYQTQLTVIGATKVKVEYQTRSQYKRTGQICKFINLSYCINVSTCNILLTAFDNAGFRSAGCKFPLS